MSELVEGTVEDFVVRWRLDKTNAYNLINGLYTIGVAKKVGTRKNSTGKGKPHVVYGIPETVTFTTVGTLNKVEKAVKKIKEKKGVERDETHVIEESVVDVTNSIHVGDTILDVTRMENGRGTVLLTSEDLVTAEFEEGTFNVSIVNVRKIHSEE